MKSKFEMPNISGRTVDSITLHDNPLYGRELTIRFMDDTELPVAIGVKQFAAVLYFQVAGDETLFDAAKRLYSHAPVLTALCCRYDFADKPMPGNARHKDHRLNQAFHLALRCFEARRAMRPAG